MPRPTDAKLDAHVSRGDYLPVIKHLNNRHDLNTREAALLGISLLRTGQLNQAEIPLGIAMAQGDLEAAVEYGNMLRAVNQTQRAIKHFEKILPSLEGELRFRALRWYGVALSTTDQHHGLELIEEARIGYLGLGFHTAAARISQTLAALRVLRGEYREAQQLLQLALPTLQTDPNRRPLLSAYHTLVDIQLESGFFEEAEDTLKEAEQLSKDLKDEHASLLIDARRAFLLSKKGHYGMFISSLQSLRARADHVGEANVYTFASNNLANHLSRTGNHAAALRILAELTHHYPNRSLETRLVAAMLTLRRGNAPDALGQLLEIRDHARSEGIQHDATKATLLAALAAYQMSDHATATQFLTEALHDLAGWHHDQVHTSLREELKDLEELLAYARLNPQLQPMITAALERTTALINPVQDDLFADNRTLELSVLGDYPIAMMNGSPLSFRMTYSIPILTYLALHPDRTRQEITTDLWSETNSNRAGANFRQCLVEIRRVAGADLIVLSGSPREPRYSLSKKITIHIDSQRVYQLLEKGDVASAIGHYKGPLLAKLPETDWLLETRTALIQNLVFLLRKEVNEAMVNNEFRRVILLCTTILSIDPYDFETEDLRLDVAKKSGTSGEVAKFLAQRYRRLN